MNEIANVIYKFVIEKISLDSKSNLQKGLLNSLKVIEISDKLDDKILKTDFTPLKNYVETILEFLNNFQYQAAIVG